jgi:hypothetical protein
MTSSSAPQRSNRAIATALWANAALLAVILIVMLTRNGGGVPSMLPAAYAQNQQPIAGGGGVFIMPAQFRENVWGCYLLDVDSQTICAYQYFAGDKNLRLAAARSYKWDRRLENFNTSDPNPRQVKAMLDKQQAQGAVEPEKDNK